jgi:hypothetical protein
LKFDVRGPEKARAKGVKGWAANWLPNFLGESFECREVCDFNARSLRGGKANAAIQLNTGAKHS